LKGISIERFEQLKDLARSGKWTRGELMRSFQASRMTVESAFYEAGAVYGVCGFSKFTGYWVDEKQIEQSLDPQYSVDELKGDELEILNHLNQI